MPPVDLDQDARQGLGSGRVLDGAGVPGAHAGLFRELDHLVAGGALVAGHQDVALDRDVLLEQVRGDVLECGDDHHVVAQEVLRAFAGAALRR